MGAKRKPESGPPDMMGAASDPEPDPGDPNEGAEGEGDLTPDMLHYSGPEEHCSGCSHFTAPTTCDRWSDPVEETGHCEGFQAGGGEPAAAPMGDTGEMEQAA